MPTAVGPSALPAQFKILTGFPISGVRHLVHHRTVLWQLSVMRTPVALTPFQEWSGACSNIDPLKQAVPLDQRLTEERSVFAKKRRELRQALRVSNLSGVPDRLRQPRACRSGLHPRSASAALMPTGVIFTRLVIFGARENSMSRMGWPMMAAFVAMGVIALMLILGTMESKSSREGRGWRSCRRFASPPSTGNTDYYRARSG